MVFVPAESRVSFGGLMVTARLHLTHDEAFLSLMAPVVAALTLLSVSSVTNFTLPVITSKARSVLVKQPIVDILITYYPFRCRRFVWPAS